MPIKNKDMNNYNLPYLEKYTGKASRNKCPKCGDPHSFAYYLDGKLIDDYPVYAEKSVEKISFKWYAEKVFHDFFH